MIGLTIRRTAWPCVLRQVDRGAESRTARRRSSPPTPTTMLPTTIVRRSNRSRRGNQPGVGQLAEDRSRSSCRNSIAPRNRTNRISSADRRPMSRRRAGRRCASCARVLRRLALPWRSSMVSTWGVILLVGRRCSVRSWVPGSAGRLGDGLRHLRQRTWRPTVLHGGTACSAATVWTARSCRARAGGSTRSGSFPHRCRLPRRRWHRRKMTQMPPRRVGIPVWRARTVIEAEAGAFSVGSPGRRRHRGAGRDDVTGAVPRSSWSRHPIGNLGDLSPRPSRSSRSAGLVCCEDTRRTGRLLQHAGVRAPRLAVCNEHTERVASPTCGASRRRRRRRRHRRRHAGHLRPRRTAGARGARCRLPRVGRARAGAAVTALVISGSADGRFVFEGFLPRPGKERAARLADIAAEPHGGDLRGTAPRAAQRATTSPRVRRRPPRRDRPRADEAAREVVRGPLGRSTSASRVAST